MRNARRGKVEHSVQCAPWKAAAVDLGVTMSAEVLADKLNPASSERGRALATWNTRRLPKRLEPGWSNRLFVASRGSWRGYFPLSGDVLWNPEDDAAPYALLFDSRGFTSIPPKPAPAFRGWRYLEPPPTSGPPSPPRAEDRR